MTDTRHSASPRAFGRRRFLAIAGAAAGCALLPGRDAVAAPMQVWHGAALGAAASIRLVHPEPETARRLIARAVEEIGRLERIFSLYRADSALSRLNAEGVMAPPPIELVELLGRAAEVSALTQGAFDATVQPLWRRYAEHFAGPEPGGTPRLDDVLPLVDWRQVALDPGRIAFGRPGMAVTLNGIAQGYVTDRVAALLRRGGIESLLLDLGEARALGRHPDGRPWRAGVADPADPARIAGRLALEGRALASSGGYGYLFDAAGRHSHLIDPRSGRTAPAARGVTVLAGSAATADGLSTAFALMDDREIAAVVGRVGGLSVYFPDSAGLRPLRV